MMGLFKIVLILIVATLQKSKGEDVSLVEGTHGWEVVKAVVQNITTRGIFPDDGYLLLTARTQSQNGMSAFTYRQGFDGGIWQVADWMFQLTKNCQSPFIKTKCQIIIQWLGIDWSRNVSWSYLRKPLYSGIGAALYTLLVLNGQPVPKDPLVQAKLLSVKHLEVNRSTELGEQGERYNDYEESTRKLRYQQEKKSNEDHFQRTAINASHLKRKSSNASIYGHTHRIIHIRSVGNNVRLVNTLYPWEGRVEVFYNGTWGTVCDDGFNVNNTKVICRMLGYSHIKPYYFLGARYGAGSGPIWLDDVSCTGTEETIFDCRHRGFGVSNCRHTEDVGILCLPTIPKPPIRLANGSNSREGRLEVWNNELWGTVCDDNFDVNDARVACSMLSMTYDIPVVYNGSRYGQGTGPIWLDNLGCSGEEKSIYRCQHNGLGVHNCDHSKDVGIKCRPYLVTSTNETKYSGDHGNNYITTIATATSSGCACCIIIIGIVVYKAKNG